MDVRVRRPVRSGVQPSITEQAFAINGITGEQASAIRRDLQRELPDCAGNVFILAEGQERDLTSRRLTGESTPTWRDDPARNRRTIPDLNQMPS